MREHIDDTGLDWCVYWLLDGIDGRPFYVGCTSRPEERLRQHCNDSGSAAWPKCREILNNGGHPVLSILARHAIREFALKHEAALIAEFSDRLLNRYVPSLLTG